MQQWKDKREHERSMAAMGAYRKEISVKSNQTWKNTRSNSQKPRGAGRGNTPPPHAKWDSYSVSLDTGQSVDGESTTTIDSDDAASNSSNSNADFVQYLATPCVVQVLGAGARWKIHIEPILVVRRRKQMNHVGLFESTKHGRGLRCKFRPNDTEHYPS